MHEAYSQRGWVCLLGRWMRTCSATWVGVQQELWRIGASIGPIRLINQGWAARQENIECMTPNGRNGGDLRT